MTSGTVTNHHIPHFFGRFGDLVWCRNPPWNDVSCCTSGAQIVGESGQSYCIIRLALPYRFWRLIPPSNTFAVGSINTLCRGSDPSLFYQFKPFLPRTFQFTTLDFFFRRNISSNTFTNSVQFKFLRKVHVFNRFQGYNAVFESLWKVFQLSSKWSFAYLELLSVVVLG